MTHPEGTQDEAAASPPPPLDTGLACLVMLARFLEKAADPEQLRHKSGLGGALFDEVALLGAARDLGFKAKAVETDVQRLGKTPLPAIASRPNGTYFHCCPAKS